MSRFCATASIKAEILTLADAGWKAEDIADEYGCHPQTVYRIAVGRLKVKGGLKGKDLKRLRRIVVAGETAETGQREEIARRFGLKDRHSFNGVLSYARKVLAAEARP